jgi:hypothetical protein
MHYLVRRYGRRPARRAMGDISSVIGTALDVASDPYLSEVVCRVGQLKNIDHGETVGVCAETPEGTAGGVGLRNAIVPLRAYVYAQQNKWVYPVALAVAIGIPMWIGYELGRGPR